MPLGRRALLRGGALAVGGLTAAALIGCGGDDDEAAAPDAAASGAQTAIDMGDMAALARERSLRTAVGLQGRSDPAVRYAHDLIADGFVGEVLTANLSITTQAAWERGDRRPRSGRPAGDRRHTRRRPRGLSGAGYG